MKRVVGFEGSWPTAGPAWIVRVPFSNVGVVPSAGLQVRS